MLIRFYASTGKDRETGLAKALADGCEQFDDHVEIAPTDGYAEPDPMVDVACAYGVKGHTKEIVDSYVAAGKRAIMFDKALIRSGSSAGYHRVCIDEGTPLRYMMRKLRTWERWERLGIRLGSRRLSAPGHAVIFAGSSQKYCSWHGLGDATKYATETFEAIRGVLRKRPLIYRPKPSWTGFEPIHGTTLSRDQEMLSDLLPRAHVLVTHGSSAAIDAIVAGVPAITLGPCAANPVAGSQIAQVREPPFPSDEARFHWLCQISYCQWKLSEFASGEAWAFIRRELEETASAA